MHKNLKCLFVFLFLFVSKFVFAQNYYKISSFDIVILGSSNLHDWSANVTKVSGNLFVQNNTINNVNISVDATTIQSSRGKIMDNKLQDALKTDLYPIIAYKCLLNSKLAQIGKSLIIEAKGSFTIAGVTKKSTQIVKCFTKSNKNIQVSGNLTFFMSDFNIIPPTAMFGTLVTDDKVTVSYSIIFS